MENHAFNQDLSIEIVKSDKKRTGRRRGINKESNPKLMQIVRMIINANLSFVKVLHRKVRNKHRR